MRNLGRDYYLKLLMKCLNASVLFDRGMMMLTRMFRVFRHSLFTFTRGPKGLKSATWVKACGPSALNISSYTVPLSRSVRVNPEDIKIFIDEIIQVGLGKKERKIFLKPIKKNVLAFASQNRLDQFRLITCEHGHRIKLFAATAQLTNKLTFTNSKYCKGI